MWKPITVFAVSFLLWASLAIATLASGNTVLSAVLAAAAVLNGIPLAALIFAAGDKQP